MPKINNMSITSLTTAEYEMLLDPQVVKWDQFHTAILESISNRRATNENNAKSRRHAYITDIEHASDAVKLDYPDVIANYVDQRRRDDWSSCIVVLTSAFESCLSLGLKHGENNLKARIKSILEEPWTPVDPEYEGKICYITGFVLMTIGNLGDKATGEVAAALKYIKMEASATKEEARAQNLPTALTEGKEIVSLTYVNEQFYNVMVKAESVFHQLLSDECIARYGILSL